jgi:hypothetical protein
MQLFHEWHTRIDEGDMAAADSLRAFATDAQSKELDRIIAMHERHHANVNAERERRLVSNGE